MSRKCYRNELKYRIAKIREYDRYYGESSGKYPARKWSEEEDLIVLYSSCTDRELSIKLKRSVKAIQHRRSRIRENIRKEINCGRDTVH